MEQFYTKEDLGGANSPNKGVTEGAELYMHHPPSAFRFRFEKGEAKRGVSVSPRTMPACGPGRPLF